MARQGISEQQVIEAAEQLAQSGQAVTVSAVREVIGSGSFSTINGYLAKWKDSTDKGKAADVPDMPEAVGRAMRHLWGAAWNEAQSGIKAEREGLEAARREMERERRDMAQEIARLEAENAAQGDELAKVKAQLAVETAARSKAETELNAIKIENARLDERAKAAESRGDELRQELAQLNARFQELAAQAKPEKPDSGKKPKPSTDG